ncbi:MAG: metalloregulator ArsR/SmtB family transcription factor [Candidatus Dormibacteraeota bacterium]|nr:metalloregulator ArsR/SmtB family transcription factor [Candidatus Dormibacteraeota bacterium]
MDDVFRALADTSRRDLLDRLNARNGQTLRELTAGLPMSRQSVSKHLAVLEEANLVTTVWRGREKLHYLNAEPIEALGRRWISRYHAARVRALADLKSALEENAVTNPEFIYTTYIKTTPERLWRALTEPAFTKQYWGTELLSDWKVGSPVTWIYAGVRVEDPEQVVLEADPPRRLAYTWQTITPEFANAVGFPEEYQRKVSAEPRSHVAFELEPVDGGFTRLRVVHDGFPEDSEVLKSVSEGWPMILSGLKTFLETGAAPMPQ